MAEFDGERAKLYKEALTDFPNVRQSDLFLMEKYFSPKYGECVVEIGAGNGIFSGKIADMIERDGRLVVVDPSKEQLYGVEKLNKNNIAQVNIGAEDFESMDESVDGIWSFGAMHHVFAKAKAFENFYRILKKSGRLVIGDVFSGSSLAKHFDDRVAKDSVTGHEVAFWSREYAESLCELHSFEKPKFIDFDASWKFDKKEDIGVFLYKLHAMTKSTPEKVLEGAGQILGISEKNGKHILSWPMTLMVTKKL